MRTFQPNLTFSAFRTDIASILNKHFSFLCTVIAHYHADKTYVEREVFKLPVTANAASTELVLEESEYFFDSVSQILEHLWFKMDVNAVERFIDGMTVYCEQQGMGRENFEVRLKELMLCFRGCAIDYINATTCKKRFIYKDSRFVIDFD